MQEVLVSKIFNYTSTPTKNVEGQFWFNPSTNVLSRYNGTVWKPITVSSNDVAVLSDGSKVSLTSYLNTQIAALAEGIDSKQDKLLYYSETSGATPSATISVANIKLTGKIAEGNNTTASGMASHAEGYYTTASNLGSHAEGGSTTASGNYSHAEGGATTASGQYSHAEGHYTKASSIYQHTQGKYNIEDANSKYADIIGNGSADNSRSNAQTVSWTGITWSQTDVRAGGTDQDNATHSLANKQDKLAFYYEDLSTNQEASIQGADSFSIQSAAKGLILNNSGGITIEDSTFKNTGPGGIISIKNNHIDSSQSIISIANNSWNGDSDKNLFEIDGESIKISDVLLIPEIKNKQDSTTTALNTTDKTIVGAINELAANKQATLETYKEKQGENNVDTIITTAVGDPDGSGTAGNILITTGKDQVSGGKITITTAGGTSSGASSKNIDINTGNTVYSTGDINISTGTSQFGTSGDINLTTGECTDVGQLCGNINLKTGGTNGNPGNINIETQSTGSITLKGRESLIKILSNGIIFNSENNTVNNSALAIGFNTTASGSYSHAEGQETMASGDFSHAEGNSTTASSEYQHVQGRYNIEDANEKYADIIGNGSSSSARSNAATVSWEGISWSQTDVRAGGTDQDNAAHSLAAKQNSTDTALNTTDKTIVGAINEINSIFNVNTLPAPITDVKTITTTLENLITDTQYANKPGTILINPDIKNTGAILVGEAITDISKAFPIYTDQPVTIAFKNINNFKVAGNIAGDKFNYIVSFGYINTNIVSDNLKITTTNGVYEITPEGDSESMTLKLSKIS